MLSEKKVFNRNQFLAGNEAEFHPNKEAGMTYKQSSLQVLFGSLAIIVKIIMMTLDP